MGLFGGLFNKKECAVCGGEIGLLGNRKLEDGNLCKNCAARLSPWFSERRHSTVAEIEQQLAYRAANYDRVRMFVPTRVFGEYECLFMDDNMQAFTVTRPNGLTRGDLNPDIVDYPAYVSIKPDIREHRWEDHRGPEEPNRPPRFIYDYDFYITIYVNHPYFDDIHCKLNVTSVKQENWNECMRFVAMTEDAVEAMSGVRPNLAGCIRYPEPEFIPAPPHPVRPAGAPMGGPTPVHTPHPAPMGGHPHVAPQSNSVAPQPGAPSPAAPRPATPQPAPQSRPAVAPQPGASRPQAAPQSRPAAAPQPGASRPQAAPQSRPAVAPQPGASRPQAAPQSRPTTPQSGASRPQAAPQSRPTTPQSGASRPQAAAQSRPTTPQSGASRPQAAPQNRPAAPQPGVSRPQSAGQQSGGGNPQRGGFGGPGRPGGAGRNS